MYIGAQPSSRPPASTTTCSGSQPVSRQAEPLASSGSRKAWLRNGWSAPAQASQSAASSCSMPWTSLTSSVPDAAAPSGSGELKDRLDLDRSIARQARATDSKARMTPGLAHRLNHQIGGAVDDLGMIAEVGRAGDEAAELQAAAELAQIAAAGGLGLGQKVERAEPRRLLTLRDADLGADLAGDRHPALAERQLAGHEQSLPPIV